ncbi:MAG: peptidylprolyl isomerase [Gammaproteobacteria bacterium]
MNCHNAVLLSLLASVSAGRANATEVAVCTDRGRAVLELADTQAPLQVANFLKYVDMGYYSGMVFHRVKAGFVVQGGGVDRQLRGRQTLPPVANESNNGLSNRRGTVAAARTEDPNSAAAQFFVNLEDNTALDGGAKPGYTVFGHVKEGLDVFEQIGRLPTRAAGPFKGEVPNPIVAIRSIARVDEAALAELPKDGADAVLKSRITAAAAAGDHATTLHLIGQYHALCAGVDPEIAVMAAQAALATNDLRQAVFVLEEYFATTDQKDPTYETATALYRKAVPENQRSAAELVPDCAVPALPTLPDGTQAALDEMMASQKKVKEFVAAGDVYLKCLAKVIDNKDRSVEERNTAVNEHNRMVGAMEQTAAGFNDQIKKFKTRG